MIIDNSVPKNKTETEYIKDATTRSKVIAAEEFLPRIEKPGYEIIPEMKKIYRMTAEELKHVKNFQIKNKWGSIEFDDETDIMNVNIDEIINIAYEEVIVYPEDSSKPPIGQKLNKPDTIHLYKCFPKNKDEKSKVKFEKKLIAVTKQQNSKFISYDK